MKIKIIESRSLMGSVMHPGQHKYYLDSVTSFLLTFNCLPPVGTLIVPGYTYEGATIEQYRIDEKKLLIFVDCE